MSKFKERELALQLRSKGLSYSEVLKRVPVAKSTLSLWLRDVGLSKRQKQRLTAKRLAAALKGAEAKRSQRVARVAAIYQQAEKEIERLSNRELWLMGLMLYWAEGTKEKEQRPGSGVIFTNSDPFMVKLFLKWLTIVGKVSADEISFDIFIHKNSQNNLSRVIKYWLAVTGLKRNCFKKVYFKKHKPKIKRDNVGLDYYGLVKLKVKASSFLQRKISGWIRGINKYYWGVAKW